MSHSFEISESVRLFDCDAQGHLAGANYLNFANQAFWSCLRSAGVDVDAMLRDGMGPVHLETKLRYLREFRAGDRAKMACQLKFGGGKTYRVKVEFRDDSDELAAEVETICGLLDFATRRLSPDPAARWRERAMYPERLGL